MRLDQWRAEIGENLKYIEAGAELAARRAKMLPTIPEWETLAEAELAKSRKVLETALNKIIAAQQAFAVRQVEKVA